METNLRSLVALVLLLVPFLAGKYTCYIFPQWSYIVLLFYFICSFLTSVLNEDKALSMQSVHCNTKSFFSPQLPGVALMEQFVWLMDQLRVQAEWRSASMECGEEFVGVICVPVRMAIIPELCVDSWGTMLMQEKV